MEQEFVASSAATQEVGWLRPLSGLGRVLVRLYSTRVGRSLP